MAGFRNLLMSSASINKLLKKVYLHIRVAIHIAIHLFSIAFTTLLRS